MSFYSLRQLIVRSETLDAIAEILAGADPAEDPRAVLAACRAAVDRAEPEREANLTGLSRTSDFARVGN